MCHSGKCWHEGFTGECTLGMSHCKDGGTVTGRFELKTSNITEVPRLSRSEAAALIRKYFIMYPELQSLFSEEVKKSPFDLTSGGTVPSSEPYPSVRRAMSTEEFVAQWGTLVRDYSDVKCKHPGCHAVDPCEGCGKENHV